MHYLDKPDAPGELLHFGVKGMKWGTRKSHPMHSDYTPNRQSRDRSELAGRGSVRRINNRMHAGKTHAQARKAEKRLVRNVQLAAIGGVAAVKALQVFGPVAIQHIAIKAHNNRLDANANRNTTGDPTFAKQRRGAYNITNI